MPMMCPHCGERLLFDIVLEPQIDARGMPSLAGEGKPVFHVKRVEPGSPLFPRYPHCHQLLDPGRVQEPDSTINQMS